MKEFIVYGSLKEYLDAGHTEDSVLYWEKLPRFTRGWNAKACLSNLLDIGVSGKWLVTSEGEVIPILGIFKWYSGYKIHGQVCAVFLDTAYGRYELKENYKCQLHMDARPITQANESFIRYIVNTGNFWTAFMLAKPVLFEKLEGDPHKILTYLKRHQVLNEEFWRKLRNDMSKTDFTQMTQTIFPTATAKKTLEDVMNDKTEEGKVRVSAALGVLEQAVEFEKIIVSINADTEKLPPSQTVKPGLLTGNDMQKKLPSPFISGAVGVSEIN